MREPRLTHQQARPLVESALARLNKTPPTLLFTQTAQSVAYLESHYGDDYQNDTIASHNWGSVHCKTPTAPCPDCWTAKDVSPKTGKKYTACFRIYPDHSEGAFDVVRELYRRREVRDAVTTGSTLQIADAMERTSYFRAHPSVRTKRVWEYAFTMSEVSKEIARHMREPLLLTPPGPPPAPLSAPAMDTPHTGKSAPLFALIALAFLARRG